MDSYWHLYFFLAVIFPDCAVGIVHGVPAGNLANKIVGIMWQYHDGTRGGFCIGTPITKKRVVTTASCLSKAFKDKGPEVTDWRYGKKVQFKVYMDLFTKKFNGLWSEETAVDILKNPLPALLPISDPPQAEGLFKEAHWNDLAFLDFAYDSFESDAVSPTCASLGRNDIQDNEQLLVIGVGQREHGGGSNTAYLKNVTAHIGKHYKNDFFENPHIIVTTNAICKGDEGAPLLSTSTLAKLCVRGVASFASNQQHVQQDRYTHTGEDSPMKQEPKCYGDSDCLRFTDSVFTKIAEYEQCLPENDKTDDLWNTFYR